MYNITTNYTETGAISVIPYNQDLVIILLSVIAFCELVRLVAFFGSMILSDEVKK